MEERGELTKGAVRVGEGYTVEASGFADDLVRYDGATVLDRSLTKAEAEATAKKYARQLMAEKSATGRVRVRRDGELVKDVALVNGAWVVTFESRREYRVAISDGWDGWVGLGGFDSRDEADRAAEGARARGLRASINEITRDGSGRIVEQRLVA